MLDMFVVAEVLLLVEEGAAANIKLLLLLLLFVCCCCLVKISVGSSINPVCSAGMSSSLCCPAISSKLPCCKPPVPFGMFNIKLVVLSCPATWFSVSRLMVGW